MAARKPVIEGSDAQKKADMAEFLDKEFEHYRGKHGWRTTANDWAKHLGVNNAALSTWMNETRLPTGTNKHKLAAKLGPKIYDILREPRMMPEDPEFHEVAELWFAADRKTQARIKDLLLDLTKDGDSAGAKGGRKAATT